MTMMQQDIRLSVSQQDNPSAHPGHVVVHLEDDPNYQDKHRNNAKIVALVDYVIAVVVIIILIALITTSFDFDHSNSDDSKSSKGEQLISISIKSTFLVLLCCGIWITIFLLKSTKPTTPHQKAVQLAKHWLFYNTLVVILTTISITLLLMYKNYLLGFGGIGFLIVRLVFIGIVFRFWRELKSGGEAATAESGQDLSQKRTSN